MMKHDDIKEDKKLIKKAFKMHDDQLHEHKKTNLSKLKKGGKIKKMSAGGVAGVGSESMKALGRNMARVNYQRGG
jgi:hypothetical protein